jgi:hypothetical protein
MVEDWYQLIGGPPRTWTNLQVKEFPDVTYFSDFAKGFSIAVKQEQVSYVTLQSGRNPRLPQYQGPLPYGLAWDETNASIVRRLGEPSHATRPPSRGLGIELTYEGLGLTVELMSNEWEDTANLSRTLVLFAAKLPSLQPFKHPPGTYFCAVCGQPSALKCGRCRLINYCGAICQREHWTRHKLQCIGYSSNIN